MTNSIRCKRIINGNTYNTETATLLGGPVASEGPYEEALFKTRLGAYFLYVDDTANPSEFIVPQDFDQAQKWMERNCTPERTEAEFGEMPEAGNTEARFTLRLPESLRKQASALADRRSQSLNAWILRCIEQGVSAQETSDAR